MTLRTKLFIIIHANKIGAKIYKLIPKQESGFQIKKDIDRVCKVLSKEKTFKITYHDLIATIGFE